MNWFESRVKNGNDGYDAKLHVNLKEKQALVFRVFLSVTLLVLLLLGFIQFLRQNLVLMKTSVSKIRSANASSAVSSTTAPISSQMAW